MGNDHIGCGQCLDRIENEMHLMRSDIQHVNIESLNEISIHQYNNSVNFVKYLRTRFTKIES